MDPQMSRIARLTRTVTLTFAIAALALALGGCAQASDPSARNAQHFVVDLSSGSYVPSAITAKAGTPISITFGQGSGCLQTLVFPAFNINADLTQGPKTFDLGVLQPGEYPWNCGMNMQHGSLKVE